MERRLCGRLRLLDGGGEELVDPLGDVAHVLEGPRRDEARGVGGERAGGRRASSRRRAGRQRHLHRRASTTRQRQLASREGAREQTEAEAAVWSMGSGPQAPADQLTSSKGLARA
eukprot:6198587-Pleurochrysis_carterae.AAC.1